jgi:hypothetical protein
MFIVYKNRIQIKFSYLILSCIVGNGGWSHWTRNSTCTVNCGGGIQLYTRSCTNPSPNEIGTSCVGESYYEEVCNTNNCVCKFDGKRNNVI